MNASKAWYEDPEIKDYSKDPAGGHFKNVFHRKANKKKGVREDDLQDEGVKEDTIKLRLTRPSLKLKAKCNISAKYWQFCQYQVLLYKRFSSKNINQS